MLMRMKMAIITNCAKFPVFPAKVSQKFSRLICSGKAGGFKAATLPERAHFCSGSVAVFGTSAGKVSGNKCVSKARKKQAVADSNKSMDEAQVFLRNILGAMTVPYLQKNPTAGRVLELIRDHEQGPICYDHFAYRTFGIHGCGINSIAQIFLDLGYEVRDELRFPAKKLRALWFSPPDRDLDCQGDAIDGALPRVFISELLVDELSPQAQKIIRKYTSCSAPIAKHAALAGATNSLTWPVPELSDYQELTSESEYAAWTLVNGYALNHATVSVHRLNSDLKKIDTLNAFLESKGIKLNSEGSILKVSPDGGLQQSSTVADVSSFAFAGGEIRTVPGSYIEFAERLVIPKFQHLRPEEIQEWHRRDGFEVGNADKIFESTSADQIGVQAK